MVINEIANKARNSISKYCIQECKALCCRKGLLQVNSKELNLITNNNPQKVFSNGNDSFAIDLSPNCPSLQNNMCKIHKDPARPKVCQDFPIFIEKNHIRFAKNCPAVQNNLFYSFQKEFIKLGFQIVTHS